MARESLAPGSCYFYYPRLLCVVGARDDDRDTTNFAPVTWATPLSSDPPLFGVCLSPSTHTHHLVLRSGEFTVSFLTAEHADDAAALGATSGRDTDKAKALALALAPGETVAAASLAAAYAAAECTLLARHQIGDQTLIVGEVQRLHVSDDAFDGAGVLRLERVSPLLYLGGNRYATTTGTAIRPSRRSGA